MASTKLKITTPPARLIGGSLYNPRTTNQKGEPLLFKSGASKGQPRSEWSFGVAVAKKAGQMHWSEHPFFAPIWAYGHQVQPSAAQRPDFSWKITDGDSTIPNKSNKKPCDGEGYKGHWIVWFSGGQAPQVWNADGTARIMEKDAVKPGYFIQVFGDVDDNESTDSPGLYFNHRMVALSGYGPEISIGPDVSAAGFGQGVVLPAGASAAPVGQMPNIASPGAGAPPPPPLIPNVAPPAPAAAPWPPTGWIAHPTAPGHFYMGEEVLTEADLRARVAPAPLPPAGSAPPPPPPAPTALAVTPNPAILSAGAPPPPPMASAKALTAAAPPGSTYEGLIAVGWTDALLVQHGYILPY